MGKICNKCGEKLGFRKGIPYSFDDKDLLLCKSCVEKIEKEKLIKIEEERRQNEEKRLIDEERQRKEEEKQKKDEEEWIRESAKSTKEKMDKVYERHKQKHVTENIWNAETHELIDKRVPFRIISKDLIVFLNEYFQLGCYFHSYLEGDSWQAHTLDRQKRLSILTKLERNGLLDELIMEKTFKEPEVVFAHYDSELKKDSKNVTAWVNKGLSLIHLKKAEEAWTCFKKASEIDSESTISFYDKILKNFPDFEFIWFVKGCTLYWHEKYDDALTCYDKVLEINPKDDDVWVKKAAILNILERYEEAIVCCDRALEIEPENSLAHEIKLDSIAKKS